MKTIKLNKNLLNPKNYHLSSLKLSSTFLTLFLLVVSVAGQKKVVNARFIESFDQDSLHVSVYFNDPSIYLPIISKGYTDLEQLNNDTAKGNQWFHFLLKHVPYVFDVTNKKTGKQLFFILHGDEKLKDSVFFCRLDIVDADKVDEIDPQKAYPASAVIRSINNSGYRATLVTDMAIFQTADTKKLSGGTKFLGYIMRIYNYDDIKKPLLYRIQHPENYK